MRVRARLVVGVPDLLLALELGLQVGHLRLRALVLAP